MEEPEWNLVIGQHQRHGRTQGWHAVDAGGALGGTSGGPNSMQQGALGTVKGGCSEDQGANLKIKPKKELKTDDVHAKEDGAENRWSGGPDDPQTGGAGGATSAGVVVESDLQPHTFVARNSGV